MLKLFKIVPALLALPLLLTGCETEEIVAQAEGVLAKVGQMLGKKQAGPGAAGMMGRVTRVTLVEMVPQKADIERELTGRTKAYRWAEVRPEVGGILKERCFTEGAMVKEGDVLYRVEPAT
ncbi:MAG: hypothetical protein MJ061_01175 [Mailhella sp.]|nr:hypothetical protein [Mailhella sp.]